MTELVLVTLDLDREMRVEMNVSDFAIGGVLSMKCEEELRISLKYRWITKTWSTL